MSVPELFDTLELMDIKSALNKESSDKQPKGK